MQFPPVSEAERWLHRDTERRFFSLIAENDLFVVALEVQLPSQRLLVIAPPGPEPTHLWARDEGVFIRKREHQRILSDIVSKLPTRGKVWVRLICLGPEK